MIDQVWHMTDYHQTSRKPMRPSLQDYDQALEVYERSSLATQYKSEY